MNLRLKTYRLNPLYAVNFRDGVHLTAEGSEIVAEEILKVLEEADWEPSLHWKTLPIEFDIPIELSP